MLTGKYDQKIQEILTRYPQDQKQSAALPLLQLAQKEDGFISKESLVEIGELVGLEPTQVAGLSSFYSLLHDQPTAKRHIQICTDLPCSLRGAGQFASDLCECLGVQPGETTPDGEFLVEHVSCLAGCHKAPVFQVQDRDGTHYFESDSPAYPMTPERAMEMLESIKQQGKAE